MNPERAASACAASAADPVTRGLVEAPRPIKNAHENQGRGQAIGRSRVDPINIGLGVFEKPRRRCYHQLGIIGNHWLSFRIENDAVHGFKIDLHRDHRVHKITLQMPARFSKPEKMLARQKGQILMAVGDAKSSDRIPEFRGTVFSGTVFRGIIDLTLIQKR